MHHEHRFWSAENRPSAGFVQHVLVVAGILSLIYLVWQVRDAFLMLVAGIIVAVLLLAAANPIRRWTGLSHRWSLTIATVLIALLLLAAGWLTGSQVRSQVSDVTSRLPQAIQTLEGQLGLSVLSSGSGSGQAGVAASGQQNGGAGLPIVSDTLSRLTTIGYTVLEVIAGLILVVAAGVFLAADPGTYRRGLVKLFPPAQHKRVDDTLKTSGRALHQWLLAELIAMAIVAVLVGSGTWLIGLPAPLALAIFAGLTEFIPIAGPILGAIPAVLLALKQSTSTALWTVLLFLAIQQIESNVVTPIVQRRMVEIPPVVLLFAVLAFGLLFGPLGIIVAAPLTVLVFVAVKKLYVRQTLGEATDVPGER